MRIFEKLGFKGVKKDWDDCAPCVDTMDAQLNAQLKTILDEMPPSAYDVAGALNGYKIRSSFEDMAEALKLRDQHTQFRPCGVKPASNADSVVLSGECAQRVQDIFVQFFNSEDWKNLEDFNAAWKAIPDIAKKIELHIDGKAMQTPASIYMNIRGSLQLHGHLKSDSRSGDVVNMDGSAYEPKVA